MIYCFLQLTHSNPFSKHIHHIHHHPRKENFKCSAELLPISHHKERSTPRINSGDVHFVGFPGGSHLTEGAWLSQAHIRMASRGFWTRWSGKSENPPKDRHSVFCGRDGFHWHYRHVGFQRWLASIFYPFYSLSMTQSEPSFRQIVHMATHISLDATRKKQWVTKKWNPFFTIALWPGTSTVRLPPGKQRPGRRVLLKWKHARNLGGYRQFLGTM